MKKLAVLLMQFPAASETFASNDVRHMSTIVDTSVYCLKMKSKNSDSYLTERNLQDVNINNVKVFDMVKSLLKSPFYFRELLYLFYLTLMEIKAMNFASAFKFLLLYPSVLLQYCRIRKDGISHLHLFWGHYPSLVGLLMKRFHPEITLSTFVGAYDLELNLFITEKMLNQSDFTFTHTKGNAKYLSNRYGIDEPKVIYRGIDLDFFSETRNAIIQDKDQFFTAGRLIEEKGFDHVIKVFHRLKVEKIFSDTRLLIAGEGQDRQRLESLVARLGLRSSITFLGHIPQSEIRGYISNSRGFIFLSRYKGERLPNVVKEAMYLQKICFVSDTKDIEELVEDGKNGFVFRGKSHDEISRQVVQYFTLPTDVRNDFTENAKDKVVNKFSVSASIHAFLEELGLLN